MHKQKCVTAILSFVKHSDRTFVLQIYITEMKIDIQYKCNEVPRQAGGFPPHLPLLLQCTLASPSR